MTFSAAPLPIGFTCVTGKATFGSLRTCMLYSYYLQVCLENTVRQFNMHRVEHTRTVKPVIYDHPSLVTTIDTPI